MATDLEDKLKALLADIALLQQGLTVLDTDAQAAPASFGRDQFLKRWSGFIGKNLALWKDSFQTALNQKPVTLTPEAKAAGQELYYLPRGLAEIDFSFAKSYASFRTIVEKTYLHASELLR